MSYKQWFDAHGAKHRAIMAKLAHLSDAEVLEYFRFENMVVHESDFCPLYTDRKKCHDTEELNCYLCACPHFRFKDAGFSIDGGKILYSICSIESPDGDRCESGGAIHQNCAGCLVPHRESTLRRVFARDWFAIMKGVACKKDKPF